MFLKGDKIKVKESRIYRSGQKVMCHPLNLSGKVRTFGIGYGKGNKVKYVSYIVLHLNENGTYGEQAVFTDGTETVVMTPPDPYKEGEIYDLQGYVPKEDIMSFFCPNCEKKIDGREYINEQDIFSVPFNIVCDECNRCFSVKAVAKEIEWEISK